MSWELAPEEPTGEPGWQVVANVAAPVEEPTGDGAWELQDPTPEPPPEWQLAASDAPADWEYVGNTGELSGDDSHEPGCRCCSGPEPVEHPNGDWNQVGNIRGPAGPPGPPGPPGNGDDNEHDVLDLTVIFENVVM